MRFACLFLLACGLPLDAQRAAMFRGDPAHSGVYSGGGGAIVGLQWRTPTDGDVVATPVVAGGTVFVGSGSGKFYALDRVTGAARWTYDASSPIQSSAAFDNGLVFFAARDGSIHAVDAATGKRRWRVATGPDMPLPWGHESGDLYVSSPTISRGVVFVGSGDGRLYALDEATGAVKWKAATGGRIRGTPAVADGRVIIGSFDGRVYSFDQATGRQQWKTDTKGAELESRNFGFDRRSIQSSPAVANGFVYVGARDGYLYALGESDGVVRWTFDHKVSWVNSSAAVAGDTLYVGSSDGHFVQAVNGSSGAELWRAKSNAVVWSSPAVAGRYVYWGDGPGVVHVTDRSTGAERSSFHTAGQVHSSPVIDGDLLFVGSGDGGVYALRLGDSTAAVRRAVFVDSTYIRAATVAAANIGRYLDGRGYTPMDAQRLTRFLEDRIADRAPSVVVFAVDVVPDELLTPAPATSVFRRYLDAGGKVVWLGIPPTIWPADRATGRRGGLNEVAWDAPSKLLGVPFTDAIFDQRGARATPAGLHWGLPPRWRTDWSIRPSAGLEVLATDDWGLAAAWSKRYGGEPGTGFVRVPPDNLLSVYLTAEYRPRRP